MAVVSHTLPVKLPCIMGILNVTPDSFSDGGLFAKREPAVARGLELAAQGAAVIDVGGESTRPGSAPVSAELEAARVLPVIEGLRAAGLEQPISIDTSKAVVARAALDAGATMVNDVTALRGDPELAHVVAEAGCPVCLMHMQGAPRTMQVSPYYDDVVGEVGAFLAERFSAALLAGVRSEAVLLDPGIGFGKTLEHNLLLLRNLDRLAALGRPLVLGTSRKRFLGELLGVEPPERVLGSAVTTALGLAAGALIFRVHDVPANLQALTVAKAVLTAGEEA